MLGAPELLGRLFFTIATLFDGKPGKMVADGRPQPLVHGHKNLPDAVGVSINSVLITTVAGLRFAPGWKTPVVLVCWPGGLLGLGHGWLHSTNSGQIPAQAQEYQGPNQHRLVGPAASLHVNTGQLRPDSPLRLRSGKKFRFHLCYVDVIQIRPAKEAAGPARFPQRGVALLEEAVCADIAFHSSLWFSSVPEQFASFILFCNASCPPPPATHTHTRN